MKKVLSRQNSRRMMILWMDREVLLISCGSCCNPAMDDVMDRVHQNQCEQSFHIIGGHAFPLLKLDGLDLLHKVLAVPNMRGKPPTSGWLILCCTISDRTSLDTMGLRGCLVYEFWVIHEIWLELHILDKVFFMWLGWFSLGICSP